MSQLFTGATVMVLRDIVQRSVPKTPKIGFRAECQNN